MYSTTLNVMFNIVSIPPPGIFVIINTWQCLVIGRDKTIIICQLRSQTANFSPSIGGLMLTVAGVTAPWPSCPVSDV